MKLCSPSWSNTTVSLFVLAAVLNLKIPTLLAQDSTQRFVAQGPRTETQLSKDKLSGAVVVTFAESPTSMSFDLPWHFCQVSENGLKFAHFGAETYDPRNWDGKGADASFEAGMDEDAKFARVWIEHQSEARIVVRVRYALTNANLAIAHDDLSTVSPYNDGNGDWVEETFTIYPDGVYARHMKIHTGLASVSQPFGFYREPPNVVHEFMETVVIGPRGHIPIDDIESSPTLTLIKMFGNQPGKVFAEGIQNAIDYKLPDGPPSDFGDFRDANIMLVHSKSVYKPFTIALPYGVTATPYGWEDDKRYPFTTWTGYRDPEIGYISALGHLVNWWHYRRTESTIEQVYLHGLTNHADARREIMPLAWSWISPPELQLPKDNLSPNGSAGKYNVYTYDQSQRAYVIPRTAKGPDTIELSLVAIYDDQHLNGTMWLVNPAIVVPNWNSDDMRFELKIDGELLVKGKDYFVGLESTDSGSDLVLWLKRKIDLSRVEDHRVNIILVVPKTLD